ncbi:MAG: PKD domain-containing protein, partial [Candidatus Thermoplasmatota archaeon]|nr:PKD domain-containing protein [Candidatus Thermoplasmatota archaeon]
GQNIVFSSEPYSFAYYIDGTPNEYHVLWDFDDGVYSQDQTIGHVFGTPGTYHVSLRIRAGDTSLHPGFMYDWDYVTIHVTEPGAPLAANAGGGSLSEYEVTNGEELVLSGGASGGTPPYTYSWNLGDGRTVEGKNPTVVYNVDQETKYTVTLTVTDSNYDTATDTATVTVLAPGEILVTINSPQKVGVGSFVYFTAKVTGGTAPYSYTWKFGDGETSTQEKPYHIYEKDGEYTVTLTVKDAAGKEKTTTRKISVEGEPISGPEIKSVKGGLMVKATIAAGDYPVTWSISVDGRTFIGGSASGTIPANSVKTVKLPFTIGFGKAEITITAGTKTQQYSAFMLGPFFIGLEQA